MRVWHALVVAAVLAPAGPAVSASELGRLEFRAHCAHCHGADGRGDGPIAAFLSVPPPDLTGIQRENGGIFPFARVYDIIENGGAIAAHGEPEMPVWGERLTLETYLLYGIEVPPAERDAFVRRRILALIDHIARLQEP